MKSVISIFFTSLLIYSCTTTSSKISDNQLTDNCLDDVVLQNIILKLKQIAKKSPIDSYPQKIKLIENSCFKKKYQLLGYTIIAYREPTDPKDTVKTMFHPSSKVKSVNKRCLEHVLKSLKNRKMIVAENVLNAHRKRFSWRWKNLELSGLFYSDCKTRNAAKLSQSLVILSHELTHELRIKKDSEECLLIAENQSEVCFSNASDFPKRSIVKLANVPSKDQNQINAIRSIEGVYLGAIDGGFFLLMDELNGYTTGHMGWVNTLKSMGLGGMFFDQEKRPGFILPAFLYYSTKYLTLIKTSYPVIWRREFIDKPQQLEDAKSLILRGQRTMSELTILLQKNGKKLKEIEENLMQEYFKLKPLIFE